MNWSKVTAGVLFILMLAGCLTYEDTPKSRVSESEVSVPEEPEESGLPYSVKHEKHDDLENPYTSDELIFYLEKGFRYYKDKDEISITKFAHGTGKYEDAFLIQVLFRGDSWRFMKGDVRIKTDTELYKYVDDDPHHSVGRGYVLEIISFYIPPSVIEDMAYSDEVRMQYHFEPITLSPESIDLLKQFYEEYVVDMTEDGKQE